MSEPLLLCSDLDRTLLPNGSQPESPLARPLLRALARRPEVRIAYVSGRDLGLLRDAIRDYDLPAPDFAIGDVGTTLYAVEGESWRPADAWAEEIAPDWRGLGREALARCLAGLDSLAPQEPEKQNTFKLSYYAPEDEDRDLLLAEMGERLEPLGIRASLIWSIDEEARTALVDVLPAGATKLHAVRFLRRELGIPDRRLVFAGDSGNDLPVVTSGVQSVLVRNAFPDVVAEARGSLAAQGLGERLYVAEGGFLGLNGNYSAGVLEGLAHFLPETRAWLAAAYAGLK